MDSGKKEVAKAGSRKGFKFIRKSSSAASDHRNDNRSEDDSLHSVNRNPRDATGELSASIKRRAADFDPSRVIMLRAGRAINKVDGATLLEVIPAICEEEEIALSSCWKRDGKRNRYARVRSDLEDLLQSFPGQLLDRFEKGSVVFDEEIRNDAQKLQLDELLAVKENLVKRRQVLDRVEADLQEGVSTVLEDDLPRFDGERGSSSYLQDAGAAMSDTLLRVHAVGTNLQDEVNATEKLLSNSQIIQSKLYDKVQHSTRLPIDERHILRTLPSYY